MQVREDHVINPGGGENLYGHIHLGEYSWELPMGGAPLDEPPLAAAQRELCEETGIRAVNWEEIMRLHPSNSITDELGFAYIATDLSFGETNFEETEDLEIRKLPLEEAVQMVIDGQITDAISAASRASNG
jgi:8-oxo-dGTP pyrophosphatase MutT (NUDIX family)